MTAIPHDGWKSRKLTVALATLAILLSIATACLFVPGSAPNAAVATFAQWTSFVQWIVPSVLMPLFAAMGFDKHVTAKAGAGAVGR